MSLCVRVCVRVRVCMYVRVHVCVCVCVLLGVHATMIVYLGHCSHDAI